MVNKTALAAIWIVAFALGLILPIAVSQAPPQKSCTDFDDSDKSNEDIYNASHTIFNDEYGNTTDFKDTCTDDKTLYEYICNGNQSTLKSPLPQCEFGCANGACLRAADTTPPETNFTITPQPNANGWLNSDAIVKLSATDRDSAIRATYYCTDDGGNAWCVPNIKYKNNELKFDDGIKYIRYFSENISGTKEAVKSAAVQIDRAKPNSAGFFFMDEGGDSIFDGGLMQARILAASDSGPSGIDYCEINFDYEGAGEENAWIKASPPSQGEFSSSLEFQYKSTGRKIAKFRCIDKAGNAGDQITAKPITIIDTKPPEIRGISISPTPAMLNSEIIVLFDVFEAFRIDEFELELGLAKKMIKLYPEKTADGKYAAKAIPGIDWQTGPIGYEVFIKDKSGNSASQKGSFSISDAYKFNLAFDSENKKTGDTMTVSGKIESLTGRPVPAGGKILITSQFWQPLEAAIQPDGTFSATITISGDGTFPIKAAYNDGAAEQSESKPLTVAAVPTPARQTPAGGGGGGGYKRTPKTPVKTATNDNNQDANAGAANPNAGTGQNPETQPPAAEPTPENQTNPPTPEITPPPGVSAEENFSKPEGAGENPPITGLATLPQTQAGKQMQPTIFLYTIGIITGLIFFVAARKTLYGK